MRRIDEEHTVSRMIGIYCRGVHGTESGLCSECAALLAYSRERLAICPLQPDKPVCANCRIHCYRPDMREKIRRVMRYAGARMLYRHPLMTARYLRAKLGGRGG
jgi:predicted amidophosphoribosyltransferase